MKPSISQRKALGSFLAIRRGRLQPNDVGLPSGKRRTPGLRREEVSVLAGVSVSWYTWLEQGRDIQASAPALRRIASVLRLDRAEAAYLFALSSRDPPHVAGNDQPSDGLIVLVQKLDPVPAYIRNTRLDILAWNTAATNLFVDYGSLPPHERNTLYLLFMYPPYRTLMLDWEQLAREMLSTFRAARARAQDQAPYDSLIEQLSSSSHEFSEWWSNTEVKSFEEGIKRIQHPQLGRLDFTYVALVPEGRADLSIVAYLPRSGTNESSS